MIGAHIIGSISAHFDVLRRWQPRLVLVLDPNRQQIQELRKICPKTYIVGRVYRPDNEVEQRIRANPSDAARWAHEAILQQFAPEVDAWQVENEVLQLWDGLPLLNDFALERMRLADESGYKAAILAFSVGNPDLPEHDRMAHWRLVYPAIAYAEQHNHVIAVHQYGSPTLAQPDPNWYIHRLERQVLPLLPYSNVKFACTEFGIDNQINGFRSGPSGWSETVSASEYAQTLIDVGRNLERYKERILGYSVFTLGHSSPWDSYAIDGEVANLLATHYEANPQPQIGSTIPAPIPQPLGRQPAIPQGPQPKQLDAPTFQQREIVQVAAACRVRIGPGLGEKPLGIFEPGYCVCIVDGPIEADRLVWWKVYGVRSGGECVVGWTAQQDAEGTTLLSKAAATLPSRLCPPFDGSYPITQLFGEDPGTYLSYGLRGHNGLDLGLPEGVAVKAIDVGLGFEVQNDPKGFGQYVKLQHTWGESLYAHLSGFSIQPGQQVAQGQVIGFSGSTGHSTGPHLHLGIRTNPYDRNDGWMGYRDPLPFLPSNCYMLPFKAGSEPSPTVSGPAPQVERRLAPAFAFMNLEIRHLTAPNDSDVSYVVKDIFTTQDGSWEVGQKPPPFGIEQWARDAYLKPWNAPDVFDDAGGATHLFGAVIGLDGKLLSNQVIRWWTNDNQHQYEMRTKQHSGWANMFMNADSAFWPQNAQSGPWCWAPAGASEGVFGGGLPNQWHVSTFAVWQAVRRT